jgi:hypothetical protein
LFVSVLAGAARINVAVEGLHAQPKLVTENLRDARYCELLAVARQGAS